jgi:adenylosuccinate synthase
VSTDRFKEALTRGGYYAERAGVAWHYKHEPQSLQTVIAWGMNYADHIVPHLGDTIGTLRGLVTDNTDKQILFEGAQGVMLDLIYGSRPYCTSSFCSSAAVAATTGFNGLGNHIGVTKAYTTRVGAGPFPSELDDDTGELIRRKGGEFGATTGRERRCGWLDLVALRYACRVGDISKLIVTKLDVLSGFQTIKLCTDYEMPTNGDHACPNFCDTESTATLTTDVLSNARPVYTEYTGWPQDISACQGIADLPKTARYFLEAIQDGVGIDIDGVSVGPDREQIIWT